MSDVLKGLSIVTREVNGVANVARGVAGLANDVSSLLGGSGVRYGTPYNPNAGAWLATLQPASWRGVPFAVRSSEYPRGRSVSIHEYPFRDVPWVEDVGRASRRVSFSGFVVGDDCYAQRDALVTAAETAGPGTLVHPSLGTMTVALIEPVRTAERMELGRVVELQFSFMETAVAPTFPAIQTSTPDAVTQAATTTDTTVTSNFGSQVQAGLTSATDVVGAAASTVTGFAAAVNRLAGNASIATGAVAGLVPPAGYTYGRYGNGSLGTLQASNNTVGSALSAVVSARTAITVATTNVVSLAEAL